MVRREDIIYEKNIYIHITSNNLKQEDFTLNIFFLLKLL